MAIGFSCIPWFILDKNIHPATFLCWQYLTCSLSVTLLKSIQSFASHKNRQRAANPKITCRARLPCYNSAILRQFNGLGILFLICTTYYSYLTKRTIYIVVQRNEFKRLNIYSFLTFISIQSIRVIDRNLYVLNISFTPPWILHQLVFDFLVFRISRSQHFCGRQTWE